MLKTMLFAGLFAGLTALGACASHPAAAGKTRAQMVNGTGNDGGSDQRVCIRKTKTGSHIAQIFCMTRSEYSVYLQDQQKSQEAYQRKTESMSNAKACAGPKCLL